MTVAARALVFGDFPGPVNIVAARLPLRAQDHDLRLVGAPAG
jgi:hypothetical protein